MRTLSKKEVFHALQYAKSLPESEGAKILSHFQQEQPQLCEMLFSGFSQAIATQDREMAHLFMDLCFDIVCVYTRTLGAMPENVASREWLCNKMEGLESELKAMQDDAPAEQDPFHEEYAQPFLLEYLDMAVQDYAADNPARQEAGVAAMNMLFVVTRLFDALYDEPAIVRH